MVAPTNHQRWSRGHKAWGQRQGQGHKKSKAKDSPCEDRPSRGQGQGRTGMVKDLGHRRNCSQKKVFKKFFQAFSQKETKGLQFFFQAISNKKKVSKIFFQAIYKILTIQKIVLSSSRGQGNFRGLEASRPRTWPLRPRPRTSKCTFEDVLKAKDVFEDSTSANHVATWAGFTVHCTGEAPPTLSPNCWT